MHRPHSITWTTHTEESTTLLEATRLQEALLYTALHYTYMCNIVTEFYLYSKVYIYLINSRLDVTSSVHHHFRTTRTLSAVWSVAESRECRACLNKFTVNGAKHLMAFPAFPEKVP